jgi:Holliday junction resolvase RusA-like endonuclease
MAVTTPATARVISRFIIQVDPAPASRPRVSRQGWAYYPKGTPYARWKKEAAEFLDGCGFPAGLEAHTGPLDVKVLVMVRRPKTTKLSHPKPDLDNYTKAVLDSLNGRLFKDDSQVVNLVAAKSWAPPGQAGSVEVVVISCGDDRGK